MAKKQREVLTHKQGLKKLELINKEIAKGDMGAMKACAKHGFPPYKYSYWKKIKEEMDALDARVDEHNAANPEVLYDSSGPAIKARGDLVIKQANRIIELVNENKKLKELLFQMMLKSNFSGEVASLTFSDKDANQVDT